VVAALRYFGDGMPTFLYRCPNTRVRVQGWIANDPTEQDGDSFEAVTCPACGGVHLVSPQTGKVLGANDNDWAQQTLAKNETWVPQHPLGPEQIGAQ
jgi:hypothetical protein